MASRSSLSSAFSLLASSTLSSASLIPRRGLHVSLSRWQAVASSPTSSSESASISATSETTATSTSANQNSTIVSSLILSRPPTILREPSKFEQAYFDYNRRISEALQQPFPKDFYFKKGSASEKRFDREMSSTLHGFQDIAASGKKTNAKPEPASETAQDNQSEITMETESELQLLPRETEADRKNDLQSLERKLDRTLYLVVKNKTSWIFPQKTLARNEKENLHDAAPLALTESLGSNMDIWMVSNMPVGVYQSGESEKTYFMRAHIVAGNASLETVNEIQEYKWLTKDEIKALAVQEQNSEYWNNVGELLDE